MNETKALGRSVPFGGTFEVISADEPDQGGASHAYSIQLSTGLTGWFGASLKFQQGPISEVGVNGISDEALLCILIDRLRGFQRGHLGCREDALAITKLEEATHWLNHRKSDRVARGVEGTGSV